MFAMLYGRSQAPESLPWHREEVPGLLRAVVERGRGGRALDLGCGEGVNAVYLAQHGFSVVGVDFVPAALKLTRARAHAAGVNIELFESNVLKFDPPTAFDLVLDSGCLHHVSSAKVDEYRDRLDRWLLPGGDFLLVHFLKRHALDWRPASPRRVRREELVRLFSSFHLEAFDETIFDLSFPVGTSLAGVFWFRRLRLERVTRNAHDRP